MQLKLFTRNNLKRLYFKYFFTGQNFDMTFVLEDKKKQIVFRFAGLSIYLSDSLPFDSQSPKDRKTRKLFCCKDLSGFSVNGLRPPPPPPHRPRHNPHRLVPVHPPNHAEQTHLRQPKTRGKRQPLLRQLAIFR